MSTRSTAYRLEGELTEHRRTPEQAKKMREKKAEEAEKEKKTKEYLKEYRELYEEELKRVRDEGFAYDDAMEKYSNEKEVADAQGINPKSDHYPKKPTKPTKFKKPVVPNATERFGEHVGGRRRTRRGRKTRSTRRR